MLHQVDNIFHIYPLYTETCNFRNRTDTKFFERTKKNKLHVRKLTVKNVEC